MSFPEALVVAVSFLGLSSQPYLAPRATVPQPCSAELAVQLGWQGPAELGRTRALCRAGAAERIRAQLSWELNRAPWARCDPWAPLGPHVGWQGSAELSQSCRRRAGEGPSASLSWGLSRAGLQRSRAGRRRAAVSRAPRRPILEHTNLSHKVFLMIGPRLGAFDKFLFFCCLLVSFLAQRTAHAEPCPARLSTCAELGQNKAHRLSWELGRAPLGPLSSVRPTGPPLGWQGLAELR
jgi:hypothetical protein